jgi:hypothetical protein
MTRQELNEMFNAQAEWRWRKVEQHPEDKRNRKAAEMLERLATTVADVPETLLDAFEATFSRWDTLSVVLVEQQALRDVGFHSAPENAEAFIRNFLEMVAQDHQRETYCGLRVV